MSDISLLLWSAVSSTYI